MKVVINVDGGSRGNPGPAALAAGAGILLGSLVAMAGERGRRIGSAAIDATLSFPDILIAIFVIAIVGVGSRGAVIAIAVAFVPFYARLANTLAMSVAGRDYIAAARTLGVRRGRLFTRYVFPNTADSLLVAGFGGLGEALIGVSALSFLGLGVQAPEYDWGVLLTEGVEAFYVTPAAALAPALMLAFAGLTFALTGDAAARAVNPLLWTETRARRRLFDMAWSPLALMKARKSR